MACMFCLAGCLDGWLPRHFQWLVLLAARVQVSRGLTLFPVWVAEGTPAGSGASRAGWGALGADAAGLEGRRACG